MNAITLMLLVGVMGTVWCRPAVGTSGTCREGCEPATECHSMDTKLVLELQDSSVAPWELHEDKNNNREPAIIHQAECKDCAVNNWIAKPIYYQISVYEKLWNGTDVIWCKCPFKLAVGCTCVKNSTNDQQS